MDERTWEKKLAELLSKEPAALTPADIDFLRARRSYLTEDQLQAYASVLGTEEQSVEKPEKKAKKSEE